MTAPPVERARDRSTTILLVVLAAQAMAIIDLSIVNVAAPTIHADLHTSGAGLQMVVAGYVITYAMSLITGARLGDRLGHAAVFRAAVLALVVPLVLGHEEGWPAWCWASLATGVVLFAIFAAVERRRTSVPALTRALTRGRPAARAGDPRSGPHRGI